MAADSVALLNFNYEPLYTINWKRAVVMTLLGKAEIIEESSRLIRSPKITLKMPKVVRLTHFVKRHIPKVRFNKRNVFERDSYTCQYCGAVLTRYELTCDHVVPRKLNGESNWTNVVACCEPCNLKKGGRTPEQAGMRLLSFPKKPI